MAMDSAVETVPVESSTAEAATPTAAPAAVTDGQGNKSSAVAVLRQWLRQTPW